MNNYYPPIFFMDGAEITRAAEEAYVAEEIADRGDGGWLPWRDLSLFTQERWERRVMNVIVGMNRRRYALLPVNKASDDG